MVVKRPPASTAPPTIFMSSTAPLGFGMNVPSTVPPPVESLAMKKRGVLPAFMNTPLAYRLEPASRSAEGSPSRSGYQEVSSTSSPAAALNRTRLRRA